MSWSCLGFDWGGLDYNTSSNTVLDVHRQVRLMAHTDCGWNEIHVHERRYPDSPCVLLDRRLRWLVEVLCGRSVFCWWLLSMGLVAMMLSLYLLIRDSFVLSFPDGEKVTIRNKEMEERRTANNSPPKAQRKTACHSEGQVNPSSRSGF